jgi:hypothetical protein
MLKSIKTPSWEIAMLFFDEIILTLLKKYAIQIIKKD